MDVLRRFLGLKPAKSPSQTDKVTDKIVAPPPESVEDTVPTSGLAAETVPTLGEKAQEDTLAGVEQMDGHTRKLPPLETVVTSAADGVRLNYGMISDVGQVRDANQDAMFAFTSVVSGVDEKPDFGLFIVADGMGGHEHGEQASLLASRIIGKHVTKDIFIPLLNSEPGGDAERPTITEVLRSAVQRANDVVSEQVPDGGTTVTAAAVMGGLAYIAHVGDSRAYLVSEERIEHVTRDHSLVQRLIELDQLTPEDALEHPQRNVLYRALGQSDNLDVDAITRQISPGGYLLICSDGLWNLISDEEIQQVVLEHQDNTQVSCQKLVALANERGGSDNITVILVRVPG